MSLRLLSLCGLAFVIVLGSLSIGFSPLKVKAQSSRNDIIDGAIRPDLIPTEEATIALLLAATFSEEKGTDLDKKRASAFASMLGLTVADEVIVVESGNLYRRKRKALADGPHPSVEQGRQNLVSLAQFTTSDVHSRLTILGSARIKQAAESLKRSIKLVPIPDMTKGQVGAKVQSLWERLLKIFDAKVYAQAYMQPYASEFTVFSYDADGNMYSTGTTNASSGCACHNVDAYTSLTLPNYTQAFAYDPGYQELAQATASLNIDANNQTEGNIVGYSTHYAYCPYYGTFGGQTSGFSGPLRSIEAYYYCDHRGGPCTKSGVPPLAGYTYHRCNPNGACDTLLTAGLNKPFVLVHVAQINLGLFFACVAEAKSAVEYIDCHDPDPKP